MKKLFVLGGCVTALLLTACASGDALTTTSIAYQSVKTRHKQPTKESPIPDNAKIAVAYTLRNDGRLTAIVYNRTDQIMTIDQTKSFFVDSDGRSYCYYDPTVRVQSTTDMTSTTKGGSINLGAIAGALGIGGGIGTLANGINLGGAGTNGQSTTSTTYMADLPQVSIGPHGNEAMSKTFKVSGFGYDAMARETAHLSPKLSEEQSYCRFSVCVSYSFDGGKTAEQIVTNFYADSKVIVPVNTNGKVNEPLRRLYQTKPDALSEPLWQLTFRSNVYGYKTKNKGILFDFQ